MEKVKLTKEQAAFVEEWKSIRTGFENIVRALTEDYEIESDQPKFQCGDRVIKKNGETFRYNGSMISRIRGGSAEGQVFLLNEGWIDLDDLKLATPEEIYWLETLGREKVMDFRPGDVFIDAKGDVHELYTGNSPKAKKWYREGNFIGLHPAESFKPFPKEESQ